MGKWATKNYFIFQGVLALMLPPPLAVFSESSGESFMD